MNGRYCNWLSSASGDDRGWGWEPARSKIINCIKEKTEMTIMIYAQEALFVVLASMINVCLNIYVSVEPDL